MNIKKSLKRMKIRWKMFCAGVELGYLRGRYSDFELDWIVNDKVFDLIDRMKPIVQEAEELEMISHEKVNEWHKAIGA